MSVRTLLFGQSLPVGKIRLIKLEPSDFLPNLILRCCMKTENIDDAPLYNALSYRWGDKDEFEPILCNDKELWISSNLAQGLRRIRASRLCGEWLWIDQICINQAWADERTRQVQMMHSIFASAIRTVVWLGEETDHVSNKGFKLIWDISQLARAEENTDRRPDRDMVSFVAELRGLNCLAHLLYNDWFLRVWVIQEVVLSKADPLLMWGASTCTWEIFSRAISWMQKIGLGNWQTPRLPLRRTQTLIRLTASSNPWSLEALLQCARRCNATDARDHVFGLLGISEDVKDAASWPRPLIPNYQRPTWHTFRDVARYLITSTGSLSILSAIGRVKDLTDDSLPSWVPNWAAIETRIHLSISAISYELNTHGITVVRDNLNRATKGHAVEIDSSTSRNVLRLKGVLWDSIIDCYEAFHFDPRLTSPDWIALNVGVLHVWEYIKDSFQNIDEAARTFFMTTVCGRFSQEDPYRPAALEPLSHFWAYVNANTAGSDKNSAGGDAARYFANTAVCDGRQIFRTRLGSVGLGPKGIRDGDILCVLFGSSVPYLLRPSVEGYRLLGEVYVYDLMNGEVIDALDSGNIEAQWINLV